MTAHGSSALLQQLVQCAVEQSIDDPAAVRRAADQLMRYAARVIDSGVADTALQDDNMVIQNARRSMLQAGKRQHADRLAELHDQLASLDMATDARSRFVRLMAACAGSRDQSQPTFAAGLPGLSLGLHLPAPAASTSHARKQVDDMHLRPIGNIQHRTTGTDAGVPSQRATQPRPGTENLPASHLLETMLVRDVLYACQGIDGKYVRWQAAACAGSGGYAPDPGVDLPYAEEQLTLQLCELGWLFRQVKGHVELGMLGQGGTVRQAFCGFLDQELRDYYRLMAILEAQTRQPLPSAASEEISSHPYLTLRRLAVWLGEPQMRLRLLSSLAGALGSLKGGAMVSALVAYAQHGDPYLRTVVERMLQTVSAPVLNMVSAWVSDGQLLPDAEEFFIQRQSNGYDQDVWQHGFCLHDDMRPPFIHRPLAQKILRAGKTIIFLRECCEDIKLKTHADEHDTGGTTSTLASTDVHTFTMTSVEVTVSSAVAALDKKLLSVLFSRYRLRQHLDAIKRYLLLGQGDFIETFMGLVGGQLDQPAIELSEYALTSHLIMAVRASNAQYDVPDVLERLRVRLPPSTGFETGWDTFSLQYDVGRPLSVILTSSSMEAYLRIFRLLWAMKRAEHRLSSTWQMLNGMQKQLRVLTALQRELGIECPATATVWAMLRACLSMRSDMAHFCSNLQHYIMFEVLEGSWAELQTKLDAAGNLDDLLVAHQQYMAIMLQKSLLSDIPRTENEGPQGNSQEAGKRSVQPQLSGLLRHVLNLHGPVSRLQEILDGAVVEMRNRCATIRLSRAVGHWGVSGMDSQSAGLSEEQLAAVDMVLTGLFSRYTTLYGQLVESLPEQAHVDLRFLLFRLDRDMENTGGV